MRDTIVGIATAMGEGGVAIVRLSGDDAVALFTRVFAAAKRRPPYEDHRLMYGHVVDESGEKLDEAMGVVMLAPATYTREDVCELHTHGGSASATLVMRLLVRLGARVAEAGEFTRRAFMNGRIDLTQAEAVMGVIGARSAAALRNAQAKLAGGTSRFLQKAQETLLEILSGVEAHIDYPDEIDAEEAVGGIQTELTALMQTLAGVLDERGARILRDGLRVALCGRPNAGKSTLFNAMLGEERAIVTDIPGTTRDVLEGSFALHGVQVLLMDTAGIRDSGDEVERIGVQRAKAALTNADAALLLIDASKPLTQEERELLTQPMPCPCAVLLNKEDARTELTSRQVSEITSQSPVITVSAKTGKGLEAVRTFLCEQAKLPREDLLTHERHIAAAKQTLERLAQAQAALEADLPMDLVAVDLREALWSLGRITGESVDEKLLDEIFSKFCVGK